MTNKNGKNLEVIIPQPKKLGVGQTEDGLVEIEIQLRKYRLFVSETNSFTRFRLRFLAAELIKELGEPENYEQQVQRNLFTEVWLPLSVASRGELPTREQFIKMPVVDQNFWIQTAKELGHEFEWLDALNKIYENRAAGVSEEQTEEEELKKKSRLPENHPEAEKIPAG
jgi:hypothetical protein